MYESDPSGGRKPGQFPGGGYEPTRRPRLHLVDLLPPPVPVRGLDDGDGFGNAAEDGLRMLAALETLTSLEPDFCDDIATEEASVTIIECASYQDDDDHSHSPGAEVVSLHTRRHDAEGYAGDSDLDDVLHHALADEAIVEIVEIVDVAAITDAGAHGQTPDAAGPTKSTADRPRATSRFFNALDGR
jgi:hypothetical protein